MPALAVVIVNFNTRDLLRACLASLAARVSQLTVQTWVVDNASSDGSAAMVAAEFPAVRLVVSGHNGGFAYANNLALRAALAEGAAPDYILLLNPDTVVPPTALDGLVEFLAAHPAYGACGPKLLLESGALDLACRRSFPSPAAFIYHALGLGKLFPRSRRFGAYNLTYLDPDQDAAVDSVVGACMLVRSAVVREVGLLDETYFMYGEDLDWAFRIRQLGWQIGYVAGVTVHHHKRASSSQRPMRAIRYFYDAMRVFHRKHYAASTPAPVNWLIEAGITLKETWSLGRNLLRPPASRQVR